MLEIIVLDDQLERMNQCEISVKAALRELGIKAVVTKVCEPPYLARAGAYGRMPALEIEGQIWSRKKTVAFSKQEAVVLLKANYLPENKQRLL